MAVAIGASFRSALVHPNFSHLGRMSQSRRLHPLLPGEKVSLRQKPSRGGQHSDLGSLVRRWTVGAFLPCLHQPESLVIRENVNEHRASIRPTPTKAPVVMQLLRDCPCDGHVRVCVPFHRITRRHEHATGRSPTVTVLLLTCGLLDCAESSHAQSATSVAPFVSAALLAPSGVFRTEPTVRAAMKNDGGILSEAIPPCWRYASASPWDKAS